MNSAEKPYEHLSSTEKEIFDVCGEIVKYKWGKSHSPELLKLRERATELFAKTRKVDLSEHDSYFKLIAEANELKKEFEEIKNRPRDYRYFEFDLEVNSSEKITDELMVKLLDTKEVSTSWDWIPQEYLSEEAQADSYYNDMTMINIIRQEKSDKFTLRFNEMFNDSEFKSFAHIQTFYKTFQLEDSRLTEHDHEATRESWLTIENLTQEQVKEKVKNFIEIIKANPRLNKE